MPAHGKKKRKEIHVTLVIISIVVRISNNLYVHPFGLVIVKQWYFCVFLSNPYTLVSFFLSCIVLARISNTLVNNSGNGGWSCALRSVSEGCFQSSPEEEVSLGVCLLLVFFNHDWEMDFYQKVFLNQLTWYFFFCFNQLMWYTFVDFLVLN